MNRFQALRQKMLHQISIIDDVLGADSTSVFNETNDMVSLQFFVLHNSGTIGQVVA